MKQTRAESRPARLSTGAPLDYEPNNEQGVVFLFSYLARSRFGLRIESIRAGYPDCTASLNGKKIHIEFEYRSYNFVQHHHDPRLCDWIVCWIHDWPAVPTQIRVVELRREFGLGFNVWFQPVGGEYRDILAKINADDSWSVPSLAIEGDLLLFYRTAPDSFVRDIFRLVGLVGYVTAGWKPSKDWMAPIRRVCTLKAPLHLSELREHRVLRTAGFVRGSMRGRYKATEYWPDLYRMILARNPSIERSLKSYGPSRIA